MPRSRSPARLAGQDRRSLHGGDRQENKDTADRKIPKLEPGRERRVVLRRTATMPRS